MLKAKEIPKKLGDYVHIGDVCMVCNSTLDYGVTTGGAGVPVTVLRRGCLLRLPNTKTVSPVTQEGAFEFTAQAIAR